MIEDVKYCVLWKIWIMTGMSFHVVFQYIHTSALMSS